MSLIGGLALAAFGGLLTIAGVRRLLTAVSLSRSEAVPVRTVPKSESPVEFDGRSEPRADEGALEAPFSGEESLCCQVWMETASRHRTDTEGLEVGDSKEPADYQNTEQSWLLAERDEFRRSFVVADGGARVVVDPEGADLQLTGHMGETALTVASGESLPDDVRARLESLDQSDLDFDARPETWDSEDDRVKYREARLEPGDPVHVAGGTVESVPDEWGSGIDATVGASETSDRFLISEGTESSVVRKHLVQFGTGVTVGLALLGLGLHVLRSSGVL